MGDEHLIDTYVEENPYKPGADDVRLKEYGVPVWALIGYWKLVGDRPVSVNIVADAYDVPREAIEAAIAYYEQHRCAIDTRLAANEAPAPM